MSIWTISAERKLFGGIVEATRQSGSRMQAVVCTHAITLVDRAPGGSIRLIQVADDGKRSVRHLETGSDVEVEQFLSSVGRVLGLSNSALFYERAFLVVEGESEENAIPILYRHLFDRAIGGWHRPHRLALGGRLESSTQGVAATQGEYDGHAAR